MNILERLAFSYLHLLYKLRICEPSFANVKTFANVIGWQVSVRLVRHDDGTTGYEAGLEAEDEPTLCATCHHPLEFIRPGKWQCNHCEKAALDAAGE